MQITPLEIRQKSFEKRFRGYYTDEVDAFLHSLAYTWEKLTTQFKELQATAEGYKKHIDRLENLEDALLKIIREANNTAEHMVEQAKIESDLVIKKATIEADRLIHEAKTKAQVIEIVGREEVSKFKHTIEQELASKKIAIQEAIHYRESIIKQLQQLSEELWEKSQRLETVLPIEVPEKA
jgi:cell division initiation protein